MKFDELPENVRACVDHFKDCDLSKTDPLPLAHGFKLPPITATAKKMKKLKAAWEEQYKLDQGTKYPNIVGKNGDRVLYVEKAVFENWRQTVENTPAVSALHLR